MLSTNKNEDIEVLRAVAILFTVVLHTIVVMPYESGVYRAINGFVELSVGVDLFFVISGFVITRSLMSTASAARTSRRGMMLAFWIKRIFRLLPAAQLWLLIGALFYLVDGTLADNFKPIVAALLNVMNIYWAYCTPNAIDPDICSSFWHANGHYWSLSLEEQFYLLYPLLFFFCNRRVLIASIVIFIIACLFWQRPMWSAGWLLRFDAICWGVLLGLLCSGDLHSRAGQWLQRNRGLVFSGYLVLLFVFPYVSKQVLGFGGGTKDYGVGLIAIMGAVFVWLASHDLNLFSRQRVLTRTMVYLGSRSYSLYLSHLVVFYILVSLYTSVIESEALAGMPVTVNTVMMLIGCGVTLLASELTFRLVESTLRRRGRDIALGIEGRA